MTATKISPAAGFEGNSAARRRSLGTALLGSSAMPTLLMLGLVAAEAPTPARADCIAIGECYGAYHVTGTDTFYPGTASLEQVETDGGAGGLNLTIPGAVQGAQTGILVINTNNGAIDLTANGNATGVINYGYGILAINSDKVVLTPDGTVSSVSSTSTATDLSVEANGRVFGGNAGIYAQNMGSGTTTVTANDEVSSTNFAINVSNGANATDIVVNAGALNGAYGVAAVNQGTGDTSITTNGLVEAMGVGISATNGGTAHALTVEANAVSSGSIGISAVNFGIGATQVTAKDAVEAFGFSGIVATNGVTATDLTVEADAKVSGGDAGVWAENRGTGATQVTVKGEATATGYGPEGYGVVAVNGLITWDNPTGTITEVAGPNGNGVKVETAGVTGGGTGIFAVNTGAGVTSIEAAGDVAGTQTYGILAINADQVTFNADGTVASLSATSTAADLLVTAKDVAGGVTGIYAYNRGNGVTSIDADAVTGTGAYGIQATGYGTAVFVSAGAVSGGVFGISASNFGAGPTYVQATGTVTGGVTGIDVFAGTLANATLLVQGTDVSGGATGIRAINRGTAATRVVTSGDVTGTNGYGVLAVNGNVTNKPDGTIDTVTGPAGTSLTVDVAGVKGGKTGIVAVNTGTGTTSVHAAGDVESGGAYGIVAVAARSVTFNEDGAAVNAAAGTGTDLSVTADASVSGGPAGTGIFANNQGTGRTSVTVNGDVTGGRDGIIASVGGAGTDLTIRTGAGVSGGLIGINILNFGTGATEVTAAGAVNGGDTGIAAEIGSNTTGITINAGDVSGTAYGISVTNEGTGKTAITATGAVTAARDSENPGIGIFAYAQQTTTGGLTIDAQNVSGTFGILANNAGAGVTSVTAQDVSGTYGGVIVGNSLVTRNEFLTDPLANSGNSNPNATDILVKTGTVNISGNGTFGPGIDVVNNGTGKTEVTATGNVTADYVGIYAINNDHATDLTVSAAGVSGGIAAIAAINDGTGKTSVMATGDLSGGIFAVNDTRATDLAVETDARVSGTSGILAFNAGTGRTSVTAKGDVTALLDPANPGNGIVAYAGQTTAGGLTVDAKNVSAAIGIAANNSGAGVTSVTAQDVTGIYGVIVGNGVVDPNDVDSDNPLALAGGHDNPNATDIVVKTGAVTVSDGFGIYAVNHGTGKTDVTAAGDVNAGTSGIGIIAVNDNLATDLTVNTVGASGGAFGIGAINNGTGKTAITSTGDVTAASAGGIGILAYAGQTTTGGLTVDAKNISGATGIAATNSGAGATSVTAQNVSGTYGVVVGNGVVDPGEVFNDPLSLAFGDPNPNATDIVVRAGAVTVSGDDSIGIAAINHGTGKTSVTATGDVSAGDTGIGVGNVSGTDMTVTAAGVSGGVTGISAINYGTGKTAITATGAVSGGDTGILALNFGTDLTVNAAGVSGGTYGIYAANLGTGRTLVTATGEVTASLDPANPNIGIYAYAGQTTTDGLSIDAKNVSGAVGIAANNSGVGVTNVTAQNVTGGTTGIIVSNSVVDASDFANDPSVALNGNSNPNATDIVVKTGAVNAGDTGIVAWNYGTGGTEVDASGDVIAARTGIIAANATGAGKDIVITAGTVDAGEGEGIGIYAFNLGTGKTSITATGNVTAGDTGISAYNDIHATDLVVTASSVSGGNYGVYATNNGTGNTSMTVSGSVLGGTAGIATRGVAPVSVTVAATGTVGNASGLASDLAVESLGGDIVLSNAGNLTGRIVFDGNDTLNNSGTWLTSGTSDFGPGNDKLVNAASGTIRITSATRFDNLETFASGGVVTMQDNAAGSRIATPANVTLTAGSTLGVDINMAGAADGIDTTGTADISGATLDVAAQGVKVGRYTIVTAAGGLNGIFAAVTGAPVSVFAGVVDAYDANDAYLDAFRARDFADAGLTPNQKATADGIQSISGNDPFFAGNPLYDAVLSLPDDQTARFAFDRLSGEIHASLKGMLIDDSQLLRDQIDSRIRSAFGAVGAEATPLLAYGEHGTDNRATGAIDAALAPATTGQLAVWASGFGSWDRLDSDGNAARIKGTTGGMLFGADAPVGENWRLGLVGGYSHTSFDVDDRASSGDARNWHLGVYGGGQWGALGLRTGAAYTWHDISTSRSVAFPGFADSLAGDYHAGTAQVFGELGYGLKAGNIGFEPFANLSYVNLHTDGFTEKGGAAALTSTGQTTDITFTTIGLHLSSDFDLGPMAATARGTLGWRHAFGDVTPLSTFALAGGDAFAIAGAPIARDAFVLDAGLGFAITRNATLGISYGGQFSGHTIDQSVKGNLSVKF